MLIPKHMPIWDKYGEHIKQWRDEGFSLQEIGDKVGVTKERIRQIMVKHYNTSDAQGDLITTSELAELAGYSIFTVTKLEKEGMIYRSHKLWSRNMVDDILRMRKCSICGNPLPKGGIKYCSRKCYRQSTLHRYLSLTDEQKKRHVLCVTNWMKKHPEAAKEIVRRAQYRYNIKNKKYFYSRFDSLIPIKYEEGKMEKYPYHTRIVNQIPEHTKRITYSRTKYLVELKEMLRPGQAIQMAVPSSNERLNMTSAWRRITKGLNPRTYSRKQKDGSYLVYLWLGE